MKILYDMDTSEKTAEEEPGDFSVFIFGFPKASNATQDLLEEHNTVYFSVFGFVLTFLH